MVTMLLVDDQPSVLDALRQCLALEPDILVLGQAGDGTTALDMAQKLHPDIMLTDIKMPNMDGLSITLALRETAPEIKVVVLSIYDDNSTRNKALAAGAVEFVGKHDTADVLLAAIRRAAGRGMSA
jgi:DNA-binding NarL/FixJ family response regulator